MAGLSSASKPSVAAAWLQVKMITAWETASGLADCSGAALRLAEAWSECKDVKQRASHYSRIQKRKG